MARTDTLGNFLTDVAEAIRTKEGTVGKIKASEFDSRISNISGSEDLDEELNTYGAELQEQNVTLSDIVSALQGKASGGSDGGQLNVFIQEDEPAIKDGIWITEAIEPQIINITDTFKADISVLSIDASNSILKGMREQGVCAVGNSIYMFGGSVSGSAQSDVYKYDISTGTCTRIATFPYSAYGIAVVPYNTDIYCFGGRSGTSGKNGAYRFNTLDYTFTAIASMPYGSGQHQAAIIGKDIYMFGGMNGNVIASACKYNIDTNAYITIESLPSARNASAVCTLNNKIYIGGGYGSGYNELLEYDPKTNSYTQLPTMPMMVYGMGLEAFAGSLILVGGSDNDAAHQNIYMYNIVSQDYTIISQTGGRGRIDTAIVDDKIYVPGGISPAHGNDETMEIITLFNPLPALDKGVNQLIIESRSSGTLTKLCEVGEHGVYGNVTGVQFYSTEDKTLTKITNAYVGSNGEWVEL